MNVGTELIKQELIVAIPILGKFKGLIIKLMVVKLHIAYPIAMGLILLI
jgi:hypothetical protein